MVRACSGLESRHRESFTLAMTCHTEMWRGVQGKPLEGDQLQAEVASLIVGGLDTTAQTCSFTLCVISTLSLFCPSCLSLL